VLNIRGMGDVAMDFTSLSLNSTRAYNSASGIVLYQLDEII